MKGLLGLLLLGSLGSTARAQGSSGLHPSPSGNSIAPAVGSEVIGSLRLDAPQLRTFVLHGTLPLRPGIHVPGPNQGHFVLRGRDGRIWPAQVNVVSHYANLEDGADVIELMAVVTRPSTMGPGSPLHFEVLPRAGSQVQTPTLTPGVLRVLRNPQAIMLRTRDVFGNPYSADLLRDVRNQSSELRQFKSGRLASQVRTHENLVPTPPVEGPAGTLPHLMGVHSYVTVWNNMDIISLDLRIHNGHEGRLAGTAQDDPMGPIYFEDLTLTIPEGWRVFHAYTSPTLGLSTTVSNRVLTPLIKPLPGNKLHVIHTQAQFHRRIILCKEGSEDRARLMIGEAGLAFCEDGNDASGRRYNSWWNPESSRYFAQNLPLPDLSYMETQADSRAELTGNLHALRTALQTGQPGPWPVLSPGLGWAHPFGDSVGGAVGGFGIVYFEGVKTAWSASTDGYRYFQVAHRMYTDRHPTALYQANGDAYHLEEWVEQGPNGPYLPTYIWVVPWLSLGDPWGFLTAPDLHVNAVRAQGRRPDYDEELDGFNYIDSGHLIRYTRSAKVLAWLGNDAIAKDDLMLQGEICRASYTILPQSPSGASISTGLLADLEYVQQNPHDGFWVDREQGWMIDSVATAYALATGSWRLETRPWFDDVVDLMTLGQSDCIGSIMSSPSNNHMGSEFRVLQSISECILQNALWGVRTTVYDGAAPQRVRDVNAIVKKSAYALIHNLVWEPGTGAPHFYTALGPFDQQLPSYCNYVPTNGYEAFDGWQIWNMFVFGFLLTDDARFLQRATDAAGGVLSPASIGMDEHHGELETRAGMISFLQTVLGY